MRLFPEKPPPLLPFKQGAFTSSLRTKRAATLIGIALGTAVALCFLTGLFSHFQQHPVSWLPIPTIPTWGYRLTQGLHVATGLAAIPLLLLKLWTVYPNLFVWPPIKSVLNAMERASIFILVAAMIFQLATGTINITQWYPWSFPFTQTHYAISFVIVGAILIHLAVKTPDIRAALRRRSNVGGAEPDPAAEAETEAGDEPTSEQGDRKPVLVNQSAEPTTSTSGLTRRGFLLTGGLAVGAVTLTTVGQTVSPLEKLAALAPRRPSIGPQGLPVNRTAQAAGITAAAIGAQYRLSVACERSAEFTLEQLQAMPQSTFDLPIACVEGWSASARWSGVPIRDLLDQVQSPQDATVRVVSLEKEGNYRVTELPSQFVNDPMTILALTIDGEPLDVEHGYPARIMAPNRPGVLQTKWVSRLEVV
ncbi:MAG: molybdopterin-dependent oxidoreductase [Candidatus Nanopelagicales bacterium]